MPNQPGRKPRLYAGALIAVLAAVAAVAIFQKGPDASPGITASAPATKAIAISILLVSTAIIAAAFAFSKSPLAYPVGLTAAIAFVIQGFIANYLLFGSLRLPHTLTNTLIAAVIIYLLIKSKNAPQPAA